MQTVNALSLTLAVNNWLAYTRQPRILHVFGHACNLINERREVLSIVTPQIGNGPFNLVVEDDVLFSKHLNAQSLISIRANQLNLGDLAINTSNAKLWSPCPDWEALHGKRDDITKLLLTNYQAPGLPLRGLRDTPITKNAQGYSTTDSLQSPISNSLLTSLVNADLPSSLTTAQQLAGLGVGLTPAGDDFIMGAILAVWILHPPEVASVLAKEVTNATTALTTSLSAAWLRSAGRGKAGILWHKLFDALISGDEIEIQKTMDNILAVGETSGADAMAGFISTMICWVEKVGAKNPHPALSQRERGSRPDKKA